MILFLYAVMKGKRMVEPAFPDKRLAESVAAAYGKGYVVRECEVYTDAKERAK